MNAKEISTFIKEAVRDLMITDSSATYHLRLDDDFAIYVGWSGGFDKNDNTAIHSKSQPEYCLCAKVAEYNPACPLYDNVYMPWYEDGEVWDNEITISPYQINKECYKVAVWLNKSYRGMRKALKNGEITF